MNGPILALDFGGTKLSAAVVETGERRWTRLERALSKPGASGEDDRAGMLDLAARCLEGRHPRAIGVSFGGPVEPTTGTVRLSDHVPGWEGVPLAEILEERFGVPARVDNDANVAALGESRYGAGRGSHSLLYVTVSTGIGGGWILGGSVWHGFDGMAGEIGHTVVDPAGPECYCGKLGCVERIASGPYLALAARERLASRPTEGRVLRDLVGGDVAAVTALEVAEAARRGDGLAAYVLVRAASALGVGIGNALNLMNPQRVVLGGGVTKSGPLWWDAVWESAGATARREVTVAVVSAELGDDAPLWGAVALAEDAVAAGVPGREVASRRPPCD